ncbi:MAG: sugar phosphate isomerase/epimerase [Tissierellia bacterium]|nr:sugar phosphate isomerase/epimerase [Tissierellia bacterium]
MKIVKCVSTIEEFSPVDFKKLNIGVEIQDFVEPNLKEIEIEKLVSQYKTLLRDFPYTKSLHGPFLDLKPVSPDEDIRNISYKKYFRTLEIASKLDIDYVIFHSQINPWLSEPLIKSLNNKQNKEFWNSILKEAKDFDGTVLLENIFEEDPFFLKELIETIDMPNVKICLDIGHAKLRTNEDLGKWIEELKPYIEYIHFHWNEGLYDEHNRPEDKNIKYIKELLLRHNINPIIALEYKVYNLKEEVQRIKLK